jgi:putative endonuclease
VIAPRQQAGAHFEVRAAALLEDEGLQIVERNVRFRGGEIDLIARDGAEWVFVEVRARAGNAFGGAAGSIGRPKQQRLRLAAQLYLLRRFGQRGWPPCRFDVVAFEAGVPRWIRAAFTVD